MVSIGTLICVAAMCKATKVDSSRQAGLHTVMSLAGDLLELGMALHDNVCDRLLEYAELLETWGKRMNLTGSLVREDIEFQIADAAAGVPHIFGKRVVDVGSGGGLPAVVIACCRQDVTITAVEPRRKRIAFLQTCSRALGLANLSVIRARDEELWESGQLFDTAISKATWPWPEWRERARKLVTVPARIIGYCSEAPTDRHQSYQLRGRTRFISLCEVSVEPGDGRLAPLASD